MQGTITGKAGVPLLTVNDTPSCIALLVRPLVDIFEFISIIEGIAGVIGTAVAPVKVVEIVVMVIGSAFRMTGKFIVVVNKVVQLHLDLTQ